MLIINIFYIVIVIFYDFNVLIILSMGYEYELVIDYIFNYLKFMEIYIIYKIEVYLYL
jgi:hypothetical protein